jgi:hypothetical protein
MDRSLAAAGMLMGGLVLAGGIAILIDSWDQTRWPKTEGAVLESGVVTKLEHAVGERGSRRYWTVTVRYRYVVDGKEFVGERLSSRPPERRFDNDSPPAEFVRLAARYQPGATIDVYFNPRRPEEAFLMPYQSPSLVVLAAGMLMTAVSFVFWIRNR